MGLEKVDPGMVAPEQLALRPSMGSRAQKQAKPKIRGYPLQHTLPPRQREYEGFHVGTSKGHRSNIMPTRYPSLCP